MSLFVQQLAAKALIFTPSPLVRFTDDRDKATSAEGLGLLGLDHPIVEETLGRAREDLGASVKTDDGVTGAGELVVRRSGHAEGGTSQLYLTLSAA